MADPLSIAASVLTVSGVGITLSSKLYPLISDLRGAPRQIEDVASDIKLFSCALKELGGVLDSQQRVHSRNFVDVVGEIVARCQKTFKEIEEVITEKKGDSSFFNRLKWFFQKENVKSLRATLESLRSTLLVMLHLLKFAKKSMELRQE